MKKLFFAILLAGIGLVFWINPIQARSYPSPQGHVNDFADIISEPVQTSLEDQLKNYETSSSHEIAVVTLESLEGDVIENVAVELFKQWGIGKEKQDNGLLLLIAPNDRELRIEVGYGLEPIMTDSRAGTIIRTEITPEFKKDDYETGITKGVNAILTVLGDDPTAFDNVVSDTSFESKLDGFIFLFIILVYLSSFLARSKRWWPGGVIGAIAGLIFVSIVGAIALGLFGLLLDFILSKNYKKRSKHGLPTSWFSSLGGFSSGGSKSSGFGGFGGGGSGGGGSSGSW
jgi:uncharacterized protein